MRPCPRLPIGMALALLCGSSGTADAQSDAPARVDIQVERASLSFEELGRLIPALEAVSIPEGFAIDRLEAYGPLTGMTLEFRIRSGASSIEGTVTGDLSAPRRSLQGTVSIERLDLSALLERPALPRRLTADIEFDAAIDTAGGRPSLDGDYHVRSAALEVQGTGVSGLSADGRFDGRTILVDRARAQVAGASVSAAGEVDLPLGEAPLAYRITGRARGLDPARLARVLDVEAIADARFAGDVQAEFTIEGAGSEMKPLHVTVTDSRLFGGAIERMEATLALGEGAFRFDVDGRFASIDLGRASGSDNVRGTVTGSADLNGTLPRAAEGIDWNGVTLAGDVRLSDSTAMGIGIDALALDGRLTGRVVRLERFTAEGEGVMLSSSGTLSLDPDVPSMLEYAVSLRGPDVERLSDATLGSLALQGRVTGTGRLNAGGTFTATDLSYQGVDAVSVDGSYEAVVPVAAPREATGRTMIDAAVVRVAGRTVSELRLDATYDGRAVTFDARVHESDRVVTAQGRVIAPPDVPTVELSALSLEAPGSQWRLWPERNARIRYTEGALSIDYLRMDSARGERLVAQGTLGAGEDSGPLQVWLQDLDLATLDRLLLDERGIAGRLDGYLALSGPLADPDVAGRWRVVQGAVGGVPYESLDGLIEPSSAGYQVRALLRQNERAWLNAEGRMPAGFPLGRADAGTPSMDIAISSSPIDLAFAEALTDVVEGVQGTVLADLRVTGALGTPDLSGTLAVRGGAFEIPPLGTSFGGLDTRIRFEAGTMVVPDLTLRDEHGEPLRIGGRLPYHPGADADVMIALRSEDFHVVDNEYGSARVSTDLTVDGTLVSPRVTGTVQVTDGNVRVDRLLDLQSPGYYRVAPLGADEGVGERPEDESEDGGLLRGAPGTFDIQLQVPALRLSGRDLRGPGSIPVGLGDINVTLEGDLRMQKGPGEPLVMTGDVSTVRGYYEFQGRRFDIERDGQVRFPGLVEVNPLLDLTAQRRIAGVQAEVHIGGTLRQPELTLSSQPPLDEADILSLIVFNQPANQLGAGEQVSLGRRAAALATSFVSSQLAASVGGALNLDVLDIQTGESTGVGPVLTVGEQFGQNLFLKLRQTLGGSATQLVLEYEFANWLRVQSTVSDDRSQASSMFQRLERTGINWLFSFSY